jgi:predicted enzyme related to lactoylglutathione lyase
MIKGIHALFYTNKSKALRTFIKEKLAIPCTDVGDGWLIFDFKEADMGCHPTNFKNSPPTGTHAISFYCDNIETTVAQLKKRGVKFDDQIKDQGYGLTIHFTMPGKVKVELYQPKYK